MNVAPLLTLLQTLVPAPLAALVAPVAVDPLQAPIAERVSEEFAFASAPPAWVVVLVIVPLLVLAVGAVYRREGASASNRAKLLLGALRLSAIAILLLVLFQPVSESKVFAVHRSTVGLLLDESLSMDRAEEYEPDLARALARAAGLDEAAIAQTQRGELLQRVLQRPGSANDGVDLLARLQEKVDARLYGFASSYRAVAGLDDLLRGANDPTRGSTALGDSLLAVLAELRHRQLSTLVLVSDGQGNVGKDAVEVAAAAAADGIVVHTVAVGNPAQPQNVALLGVDAPDLAMVEETVALSVSLSARGFAGEPGELVVTDLVGGSELARHGLTLSPRGGQQTETIYFQPSREGEYQLEVKFTPKPGEQFIDDNVRVVPLRVQPEVIKVLYVEGRPRWQYRYLKDVLLRAKNLKAQCLLKSAAVDFIQESSKDVPALTRFPPTRKDLFQYDVIILGDIAPDDIDRGFQSRASTTDLLAELREFVELGGGLIMIAGQLHSPRDYRDTPVADVLPVEIGDPEEEAAAMRDRGQFRPHLPDWELPHRIVTLENDTKMNQRLVEDAQVGLPGMWWYAPVRRAKPGAEVILVHPSNKNRFGEHVLMAATRVPAGRTLYVGFDETWRWRMPYADRYTERFWRAAIRDVAIQKLRSSDKRFDLRTDKERYNIGEPIDVAIRVYDEEFRPSRDDQQVIHVQRGDRAPEELSAPRSGIGEEGSYSRTLRADAPGTLRLWLEDPAQGGKRLSQRTVEVQVPMLEFLNPSLDRPRLEAIAAAGGGRCVGLHELPALLESLSGDSRRVPIRTERRDLWDRAEVLLAVMALLTLEWVLRKKFNLL